MARSTDKCPGADLRRIGEDPEEDSTKVDFVGAVETAGKTGATQPGANGTDDDLDVSIRSLGMFRNVPHGELDEELGGGVL